MYTFFLEEALLSWFLTGGATESRLANPLRTMNERRRVSFLGGTDGDDGDGPGQRPSHGSNLIANSDASNSKRRVSRHAAPQKKRPSAKADPPPSLSAKV